MMRLCQTAKEKLAQYFATLINATTLPPTWIKQKRCYLQTHLSKQRQNYMASIIQPSYLVNLKTSRRLASVPESNRMASSLTAVSAYMQTTLTANTVLKIG